MKKILALIIAAIAIVTASVCVFAAESVSLTCEGYFNNWTRSYEIPDEGSLVLNIDHTCNAVYNWEGVVAVYTPTAFSGNDETHPRSTEFYASIRGDIYVNEGDGGSVKNSDVSFSHNIPDTNANGDIWDDYRATMADCDITATFTKSATGFSYQYNVTGANGVDFNISGNAACNISGDLYVLFTGEWGSFTITEPETDAPETNEPEDDGSDDGENAPQTGFITAALMIAAIGSGAYVFTKKH